MAKCRAVRLVDRIPGGGPVKSAVESAADHDVAAENSPLQSLVSQQRRQQRLLLREATAHLRRTNADLEQLSQLRQTAELKHPPPWSPELRGHERLLTDEDAWREYERRYLFTAPSVQLPPPQEVDIALLTARLTGEQQPMLAPPGRGCAQGFFPPPCRGRLEHNTPRQRTLLPGVRLPNTVIIRVLWSTRTLLDVQFYRPLENRRTRRRQHWEFFEWSDSEEDEAKAPIECLDRLERVATRRRNKRKISMKKHTHLENWFQIAEAGTDDGAMLDSEDEEIVAARRRRLSRRGRLLSDVDGMPVVERDAYMLGMSLFSCEARPGGKKRRGKKLRGESRARRTVRQSDGDDAEDSLGEDDWSSGSSECLNSDDDENQDRVGEVLMKHDDNGRRARARDAKVVESALEGTHPSQSTDPHVTDIHPQTEYSSSPEFTADDQYQQESGFDSASSATAGGRSSSAPPEPPAPKTERPSSPAELRRTASYRGPPAPWTALVGDQKEPWTASDSQPAGRLRVRRPKGRAGSVSPSPDTRRRGTSVPGGVQKYQLNAPRARPDMEADVDSVISARSPAQKHALRLPYLYELKDYACEDSKVAGIGGARMGMKSHGVKHFSSAQRHEQRKKSVPSIGYVGRNPICEEVWSSSRIPGVFYDVNPSEDNGQDEGITEVAEETNKQNMQCYFPFQQSSASIASTLDAPNENNRLRVLAVDYIRHLMQYRWAQELLHGTNRNAITPWEAAERLVKRMSKQPFEIQQEILLEVQIIHQTFPTSASLQPVSDGILDSLYPATEDMTTFTMAMDTLVLLANQMDVVMANILTLLSLERLDVRESIQSLLSRLGLVDPHHMVLAEALSWAPPGRRRSSEACRKEMARKALGFIETWTQAFETHSTFIAEEVNKRKMDAIVKCNIIKILKNCEPQAIEETDDGFNINLRKPSSINRLKNPQIMEVLNYFVEMTDEEDPLHQERRESVLLMGRREADDPLEWRRENKDILVPPSPSSVIQGNRPLTSGVLRPTSLVTHWEGEPGLMPGPWPTVTVGIHLRIADKYYRGTEHAGELPDLH